MDSAPTPPGISIERLEIDRLTLPEIGAVATEAFADDPFFKYLLPEERVRRRGLGIFFRAMVNGIGPAAVVHGARRADGRLVGVAAFVPPGAWPSPLRAQLRQLLGGIVAMAPRPRGLLDGCRYLFAIEKLHPKEPLWYLMLLAVDPAVQRGGIGRILQQQVYPLADEEGLDAYLETQKQANLAYYHRLGYAVERELHPVKSGPPLWTLRRAPRPQLD